MITCCHHHSDIIYELERENLLKENDLAALERNLQLKEKLILDLQDEIDFCRKNHNFGLIERIRNLELENSRLTRILDQRQEKYSSQNFPRLIEIIQIFNRHVNNIGNLLMRKPDLLPINKLERIIDGGCNLLELKQALVDLESTAIKIDDKLEKAGLSDNISKFINYNNTSNDRLTNYTQNALENSKSRDRLNDADDYGSRYNKFYNSSSSYSQNEGSSYYNNNNGISILIKFSSR